MEIPQKEICLKVLRELPLTWNMKVTTIRDHRDMRMLSTNKLFGDLKAYEFEMLSQPKEDENENSSALVTDQPSTSYRSKDKLNNLLSNELFAMVVRNFRKFMGKNIMQMKGSSMTTSRKERKDKK